MKRILRLANLDLCYLIRNDFSELSGAFFDKAQRVGEGFRLRFRTKDGKKDLFVFLPETVFVSVSAGKAEEKPSGFLMKIRKHLSGRRVLETRQPNFDNVLEFSFSNDYFLVFEFFSKGNFFLLDPERKIAACFRREEWRDRKLAVGEKYVYPKSGLDPRVLEEKDLSGLLRESDKDVVRTLVRGLNLGAKYCEELCFLSGVEKNSEAAKADAAELFRALRLLLEKDYSPTLYLENGEPIEFSSFPLGVFSGAESRSFESLSSILEFFSSKRSEKDPGLEELERVLSQQIKSLKEAEEKAEEYKKMGDLIYTHYSLVEKLLREKDPGGKMVVEKTPAKLVLELD